MGGTTKQLIIESPCHQLLIKLYLSYIKKNIQSNERSIKYWRGDVYTVIENRKLSFDEIEPGEHYKNCIFLTSPISKRINDATFEKCEFEQTEFQGSEWLDCDFIHMSFSNYIFSKSIFYRCMFEKCQLIGVAFIENKWKASQVMDSRADYVNFTGSTLESIIFKEISLKEAFFQEVKVNKKLIFDKADLSGADFLHTKLAGVDFSKSTFDSLRFSPDHVMGVKINPLQAVPLLNFLGVDISAS